MKAEYVIPLFLVGLFLTCSRLLAQPLAINACTIKPTTCNVPATNTSFRMPVFTYAGISLSQPLHKPTISDGGGYSLYDTSKCETRDEYLCSESGCISVVSPYMCCTACCSSQSGQQHCWCMSCEWV